MNAFLTHLACKEKGSASTQPQALSALLLQSRYVLGRPLGELGIIIRARGRTVCPSSCPGRR